MNFETRSPARSAAASLALVLAALFAPLALAADKKAAATPAAPKTPLLSPAQLRHILGRSA